MDMKTTPLTTPSPEEIKPLMESKPERPPYYVIVEDMVGLQIMVPTSSLKMAFETRKALGKQGYTNPSPIPAGGYKFPYAMHENFDWDMIGARLGEREDIEKKGQMNKGVWFKGDFYRMRDEAPTEPGAKITMGAKIWYSRGARENDPEHLREGASGKQLGYVPLVVFKGNGRINEAYVKKT